MNAGQRAFLEGALESDVEEQVDVFAEAGVIVDRDPGDETTHDSARRPRDTSSPLGVALTILLDAERNGRGAYLMHEQAAALAAWVQRVRSQGV